MSNLLSVETMPLTTVYIFSLVCIAALILQIIFRRKINFITLCRVLVYIPLLSIVVSGLNGVAKALDAIAAANDIPHQMWMGGFMRLLSSLSFGLVVTIVLAVMYAATAAVLANTPSRRVSQTASIGPEDRI